MKVVAPGTGRDVERETKLLVRNRLGISLGVSIGWDEASPGLLFWLHGPGRLTDKLVANG